ncbi:heterokaryon incompatibility protein-domain-containing protein [Xylariales sp. AK1849]|nr:heterokaryon incompatibility protein-domain-containing protein [Xylariales sp. AK1849]
MNDTTLVQDAGDLESTVFTDPLSILSHSTASYICHQCRTTDFSTALDHAAKDVQAGPGWMTFAKRIGIDLECALCSLLAARVLPGPYAEMPGPNTAWDLRSSSIRSMLLHTGTQCLFRPVPVAILNAGESQQDYLDHINNEALVERAGYLAFARTRDLLNVHTEKVVDKVFATSRLVGKQYSPELVKEWIRLCQDGWDTDEDYENNDNDDDDDDGDYDSDEDKDQDSADASIDEDGDEGSNEHIDEDDEHWSEYAVEIAGMMVIDCETYEIIERTKEMCYVTLSYVWRLASDDMVPLILLPKEKTLDASIKRSLPSIIPRVVHNAIQVVTDIGYRYLWVDQFCIDQAASKEQIAEQISKMNLVYSMAEITIIAASSCGALPGVGTTPRTEQIILDLGLLDKKLDGAEKEITIFSTPPPVHYEIKNSVWFTRGWCFQEAILSPRRLYFTDHQMMVEADGLHCCDTYPKPGKNVDVMLNMDFGGEYPSLGWPVSWEERLEDVEADCAYDLDDPRGRFWKEIDIFFRLLEVYTGKELTKDSDSIDGFLGAIKVFSRNDPYFQTFQGVPVIDVSELLHDESEEIRNEHVDFQNMSFNLALEWDHDEYWVTSPAVRRSHFPSWSWAGWKGKASWTTKPRRLGDDWYSIPGLSIQAIESSCGRTLSLVDAPAYFAGGRDQPCFLVGEGSIVLSSKFLFFHQWLPLSEQERADTGVEWFANRTNSDVRHTSFDELEREAGNRLDKGDWCCLLLNCKCSGSVKDLYRAVLLVVEWEPNERGNHRGDNLVRTCHRVGILELQRRDSKIPLAIDSFGLQ